MAKKKAKASKGETGKAKDEIELTPDKYLPYFAVVLKGVQTLFRPAGLLKRYYDGDDTLAASQIIKEIIENVLSRRQCQDCGQLHPLLPWGRIQGDFLDNTIWRYKRNFECFCHYPFYRDILEAIGIVGRIRELNRKAEYEFHTQTGFCCFKNREEATHYVGWDLPDFFFTKRVDLTEYDYQKALESIGFNRKEMARQTYRLTPVIDVIQGYCDVMGLELGNMVHIYKTVGLKTQGKKKPTGPAFDVDRADLALAIVLSDKEPMSYQTLAQKIGVSKTAIIKGVKYAGVRKAMRAMKARDPDKYTGISYDHHDAFDESHT